MTRWRIRRRAGSAADLHAFIPTVDDGQTMFVMDVAGPAVVFGSTQSLQLADPVAAAAAGVEIAPRRSGGGAVWLAPDDAVWIDLVVTRSDPLWNDDVGKAMWWVGDIWCAAVGSVGVPGASVHRGALVTTTWSRLVCFDGLGPGEVCRDGAKLVGISQRRTRDVARFQCVAYRHYDPAGLLGVLRDPKPTPEVLRPVSTLDLETSSIVEALAETLATL